MSKHSTHLPLIHSLRGIAAILVVFHHAYRVCMEHCGENEFTRLFIGGAAGVQFFFVLSGFLMDYIHRADPQTSKAASTFARKRLLRIYPTYWVVFILMFVILLVGRNWMPEYPRTISKFFLDLILVPDEARGMAIPVAWTLSHEVLFYGIFFFAHYGLNRVVAILAVWSLCCFAHTFMHRFGHGDLVNFFFNVNNILFLFGVIASRLCSVSARVALMANKLHYIRWIGVFCFIALVYYQSTVGFVRNYTSAPFGWERLGLGIASALIMLGCEGKAAKIWFHKALRIMGDASYSVYLVHLFAQIMIVKIASRLPWMEGKVLVIFSLCVLGGLAVGVLFHLIAERPLLAFVKARIK